jgi:para-nitrobenzyl esterase
MAKFALISRRTRLMLCVAGFLLSLGVTAVPAADPPSGSTVKTAYGPVQGTASNGVAQFLGIPFAAPPVGDLRWKPPQAPTPWTATRAATSFGGSCVQNQPGQFAKPSDNEDCLYLNVFTPANFVSTPANRPVMVWFYGGGLVAGETNDYDGSKLARQGDAVVVTVNYRVGTLGFFAHPALDGEGHDFGNYGLQDLQFALKWVQANITHFGGNAHNVTIFGQSGGATAVMGTLVSPTAKGLFQRIINESGTHVIVAPLPEAEKAGQAFAAKAGCTGPDAAACLRKLTPQDILKTAVAPASYYIQDGKTIVEPTYQSFTSGRFNHATILTGVVADEQAFFLPEVSGGPSTPLTAPQVEAFAGTYDPARAKDILAAYPLSAYDSPSLQEIAMAQGNKACTARNFDQVWSHYVPVYAYQFDEETTPSYLPQASYPTRAFHTSELLYIFPGFKGGQGTAHPLTPTQEKLADQLVAYWTNFARTGNPNGKDTPTKWTPYSPKSDDVMILKSPKPYMTTGYGKQTYANNMKNDCAMWDGINAYIYGPGHTN